ncbi:MAG TPA: nuclear transport factor 2 family protein [Aridibacter sp.]|nr:nuclear transport factor 2 family protein [Aridibacter sp.]
MKNILWTVVLAFAALSFTACLPAGDTTNTNTENTNTAEPAEDLAKTLTDRSKEAEEAWKSKDGKFFEGFLADGFVGVGRFGRGTKEIVPKAISENPCEVKSDSVSGQEAVELGEGVALLTEKFEREVVCDGKTLPSPTWAATVFVKEGDTWKGAYHQTLPAPDAKGEYPAPPEGAGDKPPAEGDAELTSTLSDLW